MLSSEVIQATHRDRQALIYVRQSTPQQAVDHQESLKLQYALRQHAIDCGWPADRVVVIDADVGMTGRTAVGRVGFQDLVSRVSLGQAGIIFAYDVTRLARNCSDWYQLLDLCGFRQCLIGDHDGVYDPASINGRLLLGLKGQISELELHTIRARLNAGLLNKARRGELALTLPIGYERSPDGRVAFSANREVRKRMELVFATFLEKKSAGGVVRLFNERRLLLPRLGPDGPHDEPTWKPPTSASISSILRNPTYAGVYAYGRTRHVPRGTSTHKCRKKPLPMAEWKVCLQDRHPAYISWDDYRKIQDMLSDNYADYWGKGTRGIPRQGAALLQGIVCCGQCGHRMTVEYRHGAKYVCNYQYQSRRLPVCARLAAPEVDEAVANAFRQVVGGAELDLMTQAEALRRAEADRYREARQQQLARLRYQAQLAERQYRKADPDNRLVAAELERRWETALRDLRAEEESLQRESEGSPDMPELTAELRAEWQLAGDTLPQMWERGRLTTEQKKSLLRTLIDKVVIDLVEPGLLGVRVIWKGGASTQLEIRVRTGSIARLPEGSELEAEVLRLAKEGKCDEWIADDLQRRGFRSPQRTCLCVTTVTILRLRNGLRCEDPHRRKSRPGWLNTIQLARRMKVPLTWIHQQIQSGAIRIKIDEALGRFLFPDTAATIRDLHRLRARKISLCIFEGASR